MLRELEIEILRFFSSMQNPFLDQVAWLLTFLGNETFYFLILPLVYLCFSKTSGIRLLYVFLLSVYTNSLLKSVMGVTRPVALNIEGINPLYVESAEVGTHFPHDSFPSGHAQGSATLWGYLAYGIRRFFVWTALAILVLLISIARLYTGVHWPSDIVGGIVIAIILIIGFHYVEKIIDSFTTKAQLGIAILFPILLVLIFPDPEGFKYGGFLLGAGIAYFLEKTYVRMVIPKSWLKRLIAYIVAVAGIFALQSGLKVVFPDLSILHAIRYASLGIWGLWLAPLLFVKTKLYEQD